MTADDLERQPLFRRTIWKRNALLLLAVVLEVGLLVVLGSLHIDIVREGVDRGAHVLDLLGYRVWFEPFSWKALSWIGIFLVLQIIAAEAGFLSSLTGEGMISLYPKDESEGRRFGGLTGPEIVQMVQEVARELGTAPVARIVVTEKPEPNAYTARVGGVWNVVVLHSNLLEVLPRQGVRAIIAHEVAHIRRWDSTLYQLARLPAAFAWLIAMLAFLRMTGGLFAGDGMYLLVQRLLFIALAFLLTGLAFQLLTRVVNLAAQQSEFIADAHAAQACGWSTQLNALLLVGERTEALVALTEAIAKLPEKVEEELTQKAMLRILNRFPPRELDEDVARELAPQLFIEDRLDLLRTALCVPLTEEQVRDLAVRGAKALREQQGKEEDEQKQKEESAAKDTSSLRPLTDWRDFDADRSGHLDAVETAALVSNLRQDPARMLFRQFQAPEASWDSHPTMRDRILYLYELFAQESGPHEPESRTPATAAANADSVKRELPPDGSAREGGVNPQ